MPRDPLQAGPSAGNWALLAGSLGFVAAGFVMLARERDAGIVTIAFFGACAAVGAQIVLRKLRHRRLRPLRVEVAGGVPIRPSRRRGLVLSAFLCALGAVLVCFGRGYPLLFWVLAWLMLLTGVTLLVGLAVGWLPIGYLQLDEIGLTIARRGWAFTIPWDRISGLATAELHDNPLLLIWLDDPHTVLVQPDEAMPRALKQFASNQRWFDAHVVIHPESFGMDLPLLLKAFERYVSEPAARRELGRQKIGDAQRS